MLYSVNFIGFFMGSNSKSFREFTKNGYFIIPGIFSPEEIELLLAEINAANQSRPAFRKQNDLFAIRRFFKEVPSAAGLVFNAKLRNLISGLFGEEYFVVKSIYFDKPGVSNWFVAYHQDLTISVDQKTELAGFGPWTLKMDQFAVQPPLSFLQDNFTIRIHLDDTNENNGALKVISGSHGRGIFRKGNIEKEDIKEEICCVPAGGIMIMKPLLLHSSARTTDNRQRRVLHIECSRLVLPEQLTWSEYMNVFDGMDISE
jgi:ectoine hydroxylase-related dioxygenase (phytanoyl-CoA dioxygenase family)